MRTYFGRVRPISDIQSRNPNMRGFAERKRNGVRGFMGWRVKREFNE